MTKSERALVVVLRVGAVLLLLAAPAAVMPFSWMAVIHDLFGQGPLPDQPVVQYLARSASALYAYHGAVVLLLSFDVRRYLKVIRFMAWANVTFGGVVLVIDVATGMPPWWTLLEGPGIGGFGLAVVLLARHVSRRDGGGS
jgi:hypothetical protein